MNKIFYKMMNIEDRTKTLATEIAAANVKAKAFGRLADAYEATRTGRRPMPKN